MFDRHPSGRHTLKEREEGKGIYRDLDGHLLANMDEAEFYRAVAREIANRQETRQHVIYRD
ncbi:hypothetical protein [Martelella mediterranea]|uniref:hypothetical protein n=1 Tax=Martelella mediterranea TaxID=293089 RepID=UPI00104AF480|nr:hypothetical protein [Martelella mediterranea]